MKRTHMDGEIHQDYDEDSVTSSRRTAMRGTMCSYLSELGKWEVWKAILLGQFLSLLLCGTGICSQFLQSTYKVQAPTAQSFLNYALLCLVFTTQLACRPGEKGLFSIMASRGWKYVLLAIVDVEANFLLVKAYQYTTLTSVQLLDCFTIPTVLALSWLCLKVRYKILHILGVGVALLGIGCLVWADIKEGKAENVANNILLGDMMCLAGAALYGISNVSEEFVVKTFDVVEFLGMIGLFGSIVNGVQFAVLEREEIMSLNVDRWQEVLLIVAFALCLFALYVTMPLVMRLSSATAVNLSILSADFYSLLAGLYIFNFRFHWLYFASFACVVTGVILYHIKPTPIMSRPYSDLVVTPQGDVELSNQTPTTTVTFNSASQTPCSTNYNAFPVMRDDSSRDLYVWTTLPRVGTLSHSVSVHAHPGHDTFNRRNGSVTFQTDHDC